MKPINIVFCYAWHTKKGEYTMRVYDRGKKKMEDLVKELCKINPTSGEKLAIIVDEMFSGSLSDDKVNDFCFENGIDSLSRQKVLGARDTFYQDVSNGHYYLNSICAINNIARKAIANNK